MAHQAYIIQNSPIYKYLALHFMVIIKILKIYQLQILLKMS